MKHQDGAHALRVSRRQPVQAGGAEHAEAQIDDVALDAHGKVLAPHHGKFSLTICC